MPMMISYTRSLFLNMKSCLFSIYIYKLTNYYNTAKDKQSKQEKKILHSQENSLFIQLLLYNCVFPLKSEYDRIQTEISREKHIYKNAGKCIVVFSYLGRTIYRKCLGRKKGISLPAELMNNWWINSKTTKMRNDKNPK